MDADKDEQPQDAAVPEQRTSGEQVFVPKSEVLTGLGQLAELLDAVVVHARTCDIQSLGDDARRWSKRLRVLLGEITAPADQTSSAGPVEGSGSSVRSPQ
jgi:hypothetical protein